MGVGVRIGVLVGVGVVTPGTFWAARFLMSWFWGAKIIAAERAVRMMTKGRAEIMVVFESMGR